MSRRQIDIADMQCWIFRMAQSRWKLSPQDCTKLFHDHDIPGYISECYELLHVSSYECALHDVEEILKANGVSVMVTTTETVSESGKNMCAIRLMRTMLLNYSEKNNVPFDEALYLFTASSAYEILFDFETGVWREGPVYLMVRFEEAMERDRTSIALSTEI